MTIDDKMTDGLVQLIIKLLDEKLSDSKRRAYPMPEVYSTLEKDIKAIYPETDRYKFQKILSTATKSGQITGYEIKLGKNGGLGRIDYKKPGNVESVQTVTIPVKESSDLEFNGRAYHLQFSKENLEKLLTKVFRLPENLDGDIVFDDRRFITENPEVRTYIDNLLFCFTDSNTQEVQS